MNDSEKVHKSKSSMPLFITVKKNYTRVKNRARPSNQMRTERAGQKNKHKHFLCQKQIHFPSKFEFLSFWRVVGNPRFLIFLVCCRVCAGLLEHALLAGWDLDPVDASVRAAHSTWAVELCAPPDYSKQFSRISKMATQG